MGKQSQLLLQPTEVELGLQVGVEFDNKNRYAQQQMLIPITLFYFSYILCTLYQPQ